MLQIRAFSTPSDVWKSMASNSLCTPTISLFRNRKLSEVSTDLLNVVLAHGPGTDLDTLALW